MMIRLLAAMSVTTLAIPVQAADICDARKKPSDTVVHVTGEVIEASSDGVEVTIKDDCGKIGVLIPFDNLGARKLGDTASVIGKKAYGMVDASTVFCE